MRKRAAGYSLSFRVADTGIPEPNATTALNPAPSQKKMWPMDDTFYNYERYEFSGEKSHAYY